MKVENDPLSEEKESQSSEDDDDDEKMGVTTKNQKLDSNLVLNETIKDESEEDKDSKKN